MTHIFTGTPIQKFWSMKIMNILPSANSIISFQIGKMSFFMWTMKDYCLLNTSKEQIKYCKVKL